MASDAAESSTGSEQACQTALLVLRVSTGCFWAIFLIYLLFGPPIVILLGPPIAISAFLFAAKKFRDHLSAAVEAEMGDQGSCPPPADDEKSRSQDTTYGGEGEVLVRDENKSSTGCCTCTKRSAGSLPPSRGVPPIPSGMGGPELRESRREVPEGGGGPSPRGRDATRDELHTEGGDRSCADSSCNHASTGSEGSRVAEPRAGWRFRAIMHFFGRQMSEVRMI